MENIKYINLAVKVLSESRLFPFRWLVSCIENGLVIKPKLFSEPEASAYETHTIITIKNEVAPEFKCKMSMLGLHMRSKSFECRKEEKKNREQKKRMHVNACTA